MAFDFHLQIPENSRRGKAIRMIAEKQHITLEQAFERILDAGIDQADQNPAMAGLGLFGSPEDSQALDAAVESAYRDRREPTDQKSAS